MKFKSLCAVALATLFVGGGVVLAADTDADPTPLDVTENTVTVENGSVKPGGDIEDPEKPGEDLPEDPEKEKPNENASGPLEIAYGPILKFGSISTSNKIVTKTAEARTFKGKDGSDQKRGSILQFGDLRTDANGYTVTATLKKQFTHKLKSENVLAGATIDFTNPYAKTVTDNSKPDFMSFTLGEATSDFGGAQIVATAKDEDKVGKGMWTVEYGSSENVGDDTTGDSVILTVPANTASTMAGGDYEATIEWAINSTPGE